MCSSNIVAGSNVYLVRTDYPYYDPDFVKQIQDYELLKFIKQRKKIDDSVEFPFGNQGAILKSEMRCINAKSDPCFGYDQVQKIMVCDCINGDCPQITKCNPEYSKDYAKLWDTSNDEKKLYGDPKKLALFYLVDLTSDNEKNEYYADPGNDGIDYPTTPAPILPDDKVVKEEIIYIDPKTGKKLEIIGYNKLKYPEEDGIGEPIWGVVGEYSYDKNLSIIRKSKPIEKIEEPSKIEEFYNNIEYKNVAKKTEISSKIDFEYKKKIENSVLELIIKDIKLIDIENETFELSNTVILFDNPAEMAFVSSNLLIKDVNFGMDDDSNLVLSLVDNYNNYIDRTNVIISNNALRTGCTDLNISNWKKLAKKDNLIKLNISAREYFLFNNSYGSRWVCSNLYSVTHMCIEPEDIYLENAMKDGLYSVKLIYDGDKYIVQDEKGDFIGKTNDEFSLIIQELIDNDKIDRYPNEISGFSIKKYNKKIEVLGIGHFKNMGY